MCACGHSFAAHELVEALGDFQEDCYVCTAGRLADVNAPDFHPYQLACGCILGWLPDAKKVGG